MDVSRYIAKCKEWEDRARKAEADLATLTSVCQDVLKESQRHPKGPYLHHIEPHTWHRLEAAIAEPVQAEMFKETKYAFGNGDSVTGGV